MGDAPDGRPWTRFLADMPGSPIEWLAAEAGLTYGELTMYLVREINRRHQARYAKHTHAHEQLDHRLERSALPDAGSILTKT